MVAAVCSLAFLAYPGTAVNPFLGAAVVTALVLVVAAADALVGTAPGLFEIQRRHPPVVVAGREAELRWTVRSGAARRVVLEVADSPAPSLRARSRRFRVVIPRNSVANVTTTFEPMRRGHFVRRVLLCNEIPPPPVNVNTALPEPSATAMMKISRARK